MIALLFIHYQAEIDLIFKTYRRWVLFQVKRPLTVVESEEDKETIHCEFNIKGSRLTWIAGKE